MKPYSLVAAAALVLVALSPRVASAVVAPRCPDHELRAELMRAMNITSLSDAQRVASHAANRLGRGLRPESVLNPARWGAITAREAALRIADQLCSELSAPERERVSTMRFLEEHFPDAVASSTSVFTKLKSLRVELAQAIKDGDEARVIELRSEISRTRGAPTRGAQAALLVPAILHPGLGLTASLNEFWFNHFNVASSSSKETSADYVRRIRECQGDTFRHLLECSGKHPSMLAYLDQHLSVGEQFASARGRGLNENYARELLELHTLGVGPRPQGPGQCDPDTYDQDDVRAAARILTGWGYQEVEVEGGVDRRFVFREKLHDDGGPEDKTVMCRAYHVPENPLRESSRLLDFLAAHPRTKANICGKLIRRFHGTNVSGSYDAHRACVDAWGDKGDLKAVYRALFTSQDLWERENIGGDHKDPVSVAISAARAVGANEETLIRRPAACKNITCYGVLGSMTRFMTRTGIAFNNVAPPTGYDEERVTWATPAMVLELQRLAVALSEFAGPIHGTLEEIERAFADDLAASTTQAGDLAVVQAHTRTPLRIAGQPWVSDVDPEAVLEDVNAPWKSRSGAPLPLRTTLITYLRSRAFLTR